MKNRTDLDNAVAAIRSRRIEETVAHEAIDRARSALGLAEAEVATGSAPRRLESCADYQSLVGAYMRDALSVAQTALFEDHTRGCIPCRRALKEARTDVSVAPLPSRPASAGGWQRWAAAAAVVGLAAVGWAWTAGFLSAPMQQIAQVRAIDGSLQSLRGGSDQAGTVVHPGDWLVEGERVRTADGSVAVLRLADGSLVEVAERTVLSIHERRDDMTIRVARGDVIVEAADQRDGELVVATDELLVSVKGTIFAVGQGAKGARVAVVEGEVEVEAGREERRLFAGEQFLTGGRLVGLPFESAISWSQDADRYLEQVRQVRALRQELATVSLAADLRHSRRLLDLAPFTPTAYVSLPNLGPSLDQARTIVLERLEASPALEEWWTQNFGTSGLSDGAAEVLDLLQRVADQLGPEIVTAVAMDGTGGPGAGGTAVVMTELTDPAAFQEILEGVLAEITDGNFSVRFLVDPGVGDVGDNEILLWIADDLLIASHDAVGIQAVAAAIDGRSPFVGTSLHRELGERYDQGVEALVGVDIAPILAEALAESTEASSAALEWTGIGDAEHLVLDAKTVDDTTQVAADLSFVRERRGVMSWLAAPAPMGSLEYVSTDATAASALLFVDPIDIVDQVLALADQLGQDAGSGLAEVESRLGIGLREDLAAPLGGEAAMALDGPALPTPSWKLVLEVVDPNRLQSTIEAIVERAAEVAAEEGGGDFALELVREEIGGRFYNTLLLSASVDGSVVYTFDDGYLVAAPNRTLVDRAIATRASEYTFLDSPKVRALMPVDRFMNFSGLIYQDAGSLVEPLLGMATEMAGKLSEEEQAMVADIASETLSATLLSLYGEKSAIRAVGSTQGTLLGGAVDKLLGAGQLLQLGGVLSSAGGADLQTGGAAPP